jgi:hypothetical protein
MATVSLSSITSLSAATRCRHFVTDVECSGTSSKQQKYCQYGFSAQRSSSDLSDSWKESSGNAKQRAVDCFFQAVVIGERGVKAILVHLLHQNAERMREIQQLIELSLKKIELAGFGTRFGIHAGLKLHGFDV